MQKVRCDPMKSGDSCWFGKFLEKNQKKGLTKRGESAILSELSPRGRWEEEQKKVFQENRKKGLTEKESCGKITELSAARQLRVRHDEKTWEKLKKVLDKQLKLW